MTTMETYEALALDLFRRTEQAVEQIAHAVVETGITFSGDDVVDAVERELPPDYPAPHAGTATRRDMIRRMVEDIISGDAYED